MFSTKIAEISDEEKYVKIAKLVGLI